MILKNTMNVAERVFVESAQTPLLSLGTWKVSIL